jgi:phosphate acyltransferase
MFLAMQHVKDGLSDAIVSAGPTQALVVGGHFIIRRMKNMPRVAIAPIHSIL